MSELARATAEDLLALGAHRYGTILADPPRQFQNRTGKMAPEHRRLGRYATMTLEDIMELTCAVRCRLEHGAPRRWAPADGAHLRYGSSCDRGAHTV